ncbi:hypothetical protein [Silvanigrella aquatica]|uniref:Uncharacterized protein n=1 Tax=Silvanigrella aquatica TaxID=1915309 RepID=A0A1L4CYM6_9BACT|nr:hypothetical protein [Silvanigrella aquatica]APJ03035.1 hypothetical protein AXG55_03545 [Silvanigrella aquatica]
MKKNKLLSVLLSISSAASFSTNTFANVNTEELNLDIANLKEDFKKLQSAFSNLAENDSQNLSLHNLESKANELERRIVIGNTSCYNLRKNPKVKTFKPKDDMNIEAGEYLLCGVLNTYDTFFDKNGLDKIDFILFSVDKKDNTLNKNDLLRFSKLGNSVVQEFKKLAAIQNGQFHYRIIIPSSFSSSYNYYSSSYPYSASYSIYSSYYLHSTYYSDPDGLVTLYMLNINDI